MKIYKQIQETLLTHKMTRFKQFTNKPFYKQMPIKTGGTKKND